MHTCRFIQVVSIQRCLRGSRLRFLVSPQKETFQGSVGEDHTLVLPLLVPETFLRKKKKKEITCPLFMICSYNMKLFTLKSSLEPRTSTKVSGMLKLSNVLSESKENL